MQRDFYKTDLELLKFNRVKGNTEKEFRKKLLYMIICSNENYQRQLKEFDIGVVKLTLNGLSDDLYKFSAKKYKLSKSVISTYLNELVDEGLLEVIQKGSNNNNSASFYRITTYRKNRTDIETENRTQNRTDKQSNFNVLNDKIRTDTETDTRTETWNSKKELIKRINKNNISTNKKASKKSNKTYIDLSHMDIEYIKITQEEYNKLVEKYTEEFVNKKLIDMESYEANRKKKYIDHYKALCSWLNKEKAKEQHIKSIDKAKYDESGFKIIE